MALNRRQFIKGAAGAMGAVRLTGGITKESPNPEGGEYGRYPDGTPKSWAELLALLGAVFP